MRLAFAALIDYKFSLARHCVGIRRRSVMFRTKIIAALIAGTIGLSGALVKADNGAIKGKVIFAGDKAKYPRTKLNTKKDPNCAKAKKSIGSYDVIINW